MSGLDLCLVVASLVSLVQAPAEPVEVPEGHPSYRQITEQLISKSLGEGRAYEFLAELCQVAPRRLAGSPGAAAAENWARERMRSLGFENVRFEEVTVPHWVRGEVGSVRFVEPPELAGVELPMLALGGSVATPEHGITAEVVVVGGLEEAAQLGERAAGRIVLYNGRMDPTLVTPFEAYGRAVPQRSRGASVAHGQGAVAALVRSMTPNLDDVPHTGALRYQGEDDPIPAAAISTNAAEHVASLVAAGKKVVLHFEQDCRTLPDTEGFNVIGELVGRERPEEIVLVGGHLDAWDVGEGAHDDGGGCVQAMEAVRLIMDLGLRPRRTLRVVLYANEENGLRGGRGYAAAHADEHHVMAVESDSGAFTPRGFRTNANPEAMAWLEQALAPLEAAGADELRAGGGGADIGPLGPSGTVLVGFQPDPQRYFDLHHTHEDTLDKVSVREINLGAGVIASLLWAVAEAEETLPPNPVADGSSR